VVYAYLFGILGPSCPKGLLEESDPKKLAQCTNATLGFFTMLGVGAYMSLMDFLVELWFWGPFGFSVDASRFPGGMPLSFAPT